MPKWRNAKSDLALYFGVVVRKHRKLTKTTQEKLSEVADIEVRMVRLIETKGQNLSVNLADALSKALGVPLSTMLKEAEELRAASRKK